MYTHAHVLYIRVYVVSVNHVKALLEFTTAAKQIWCTAVGVEAGGARVLAELLRIYSRLIRIHVSMVS